MIPLMRPFIKKNLVLKEIEEVLDSGWLSGGEAIHKFENALKKYNNDVDGEYISVSNATVGLEMALMSISKKKLHEFDEVIVPSFSWIASAFAISNVGGTPVFCDVNEFGVPDVHTIEPHITPFTRAIMIVHQAGIPCDMDEINKLGKKYSIPIIEDAACAFGSEYKNKKIGDSENTVVFSHQAKKCLTTGEGGTIVTKDKKLADWFRSYRVFGTNNTPLQREKNDEIMLDSFNMFGTNNKLSDISCAVGLAHIQYIDEEIEMRSNVAETYNNAFKDIDQITVTSIIPNYCTKYNWQSYRIYLHPNIDRGIFMEKLKKYNIPSKRDIQSIHLEPVYNSNEYIQETQKYSKHGVQLPFYAQLSDKNQIFIVNAIKEIIDGFE